MLERLRLWYLRHHVEITWFLIGFLIMAGFAQFGKGDWSNALVSWAIAAINYWWIRGR